ncbi:MAG: hypothetical protein WCO65_01425 [bacterium]
MELGTLERNFISPVLEETNPTLDWHQFQKRIKVNLDCSRLPDASEIAGVCKHLALRDFFHALHNQGNPAVYWFTIISYHGFKQVYDAISEARQKVQRRFPAQKKLSHPTKVLYVGKVRSDLRSRMISHLGYNLRPENHGLQLCHWAKKISLKLELTCMMLPKEFKDSVLYFESQIATELQPLLGMY